MQQCVMLLCQFYCQGGGMVVSFGVVNVWVGGCWNMFIEVLLLVCQVGFDLWCVFVMVQQQGWNVGEQVFQGWQVVYQYVVGGGVYEYFYCGDFVWIEGGYGVEVVVVDVEVEIVVGYVMGGGEVFFFCQCFEVQCCWVGIGYVYEIGDVVCYGGVGFVGD